MAVFAGCTARNARPDWIARAETLLRRWGYVVLDGGGFTCCGGTLHHAGLFAAQAEVRRRNIERWRDMGRPVIAAFCASCKHGLDAYAEEGGMEPEEAALWKRQVRGLSALLTAPVFETVPTLRPVLATINPVTGVRTTLICRSLARRSPLS